jgi:CO dehydrogenase nickel-insertion accessory protein CooC1
MPGTVVVADMEAGLEHLADGLEERFIEPVSSTGAERR